MAGSWSHHLHAQPGQLRLLARTNVQAAREAGQRLGNVWRHGRLLLGDGILADQGLGQVGSRLLKQLRQVAVAVTARMDVGRGIVEDTSSRAMLWNRLTSACTTVRQKLTRPSPCSQHWCTSHQCCLLAPPFPRLPQLVRYLQASRPGPGTHPQAWAPQNLGALSPAPHHPPTWYTASVGSSFTRSGSSRGSTPALTSPDTSPSTGSSRPPYDSATSTCGRGWGGGGGGGGAGRPAGQTVGGEGGLELRRRGLSQAAAGRQRGA